MKRILLTLLALVMLLTVVNVSVMAATTRPASDPVDAYTDGTATDDGEYVKAVGATTITIGNTFKTSKLFYKVSGGSEQPVTFNDAMREAGEYVIEGLGEGVTVEIAVQWQTDRSDTANIKIYQKSSYISVTTVALQDGGAWPKPEGLGVAQSKLSGIETGKTYEIAPIDPANYDASALVFTAYDPDATTLTSGLWAVRIAAGQDANNRYTESEAVVVYAKGSAVGTFNYKANSTGVYTPGHWTIKGYTSMGLNYAAEASHGYINITTTKIEEAQKDDLINSSLIYQMTNDQIIPVIDFYSFKLDFRNNGQGQLVVDPSPIPAKAIFHVFGGEDVEVPFAWNPLGGVVTIDLDAVVEDDAEGYIWGIELDICTADEYVKDTVNSYHYVSWLFPEATDKTNRIVTFPSRSAYPTPVLDAAGTDTDGEYEIKGFLPQYSYLMSTDGINFEDVDTSSGVVKVTSKGRYFFKVKGDNKGYESDYVRVVISGAMPAVEGLRYDENKGVVTGFNIYPEGVTGSAFIEYSKASLAGFAEWTTHGGEKDLSGLTAGLYAFRYAKRGDILPGKVKYIYIKGANAGTISYDKAAGSEFVEGAWTSGSATGNAYHDGQRLAATQTSVKAESMYNLKWMYQMKSDEVISLAEFGSFTFSIGYSNACPYSSDVYPAIVRFYLAGANQSTMEFDVDAKDKAFVTINIAELWKDEVQEDASFVPDGYVTGIEILYFDPDRSAGVEIVKPAQNYTVLDFESSAKNTDTKRFKLGVKEQLDLSAVAAVRAIGTYGGELINLDPNGIYQYATANAETEEITSEWTYVNPVGTTFVNLPAGTYALRTFFTADDPDYVSSDPIIRTILPALEGDERVSARAPKIVLPDAVSYADVNYVFDVDQTRWVSRVVINNILAETPDASITFKSKDYEIIVDAENIDMSLSNAHYFDMKVTFNGESPYDTEYAKMVPLAEDSGLIMGIHFESTTPFFFSQCIFKLNVGEKYDGYSVELRSYNDRVNFLRKEESVDVSGEWAEFTVFGGDYVVICPDFVSEDAE